MSEEIQAMFLDVSVKASENRYVDRFDGSSECDICTETDRSDFGGKAYENESITPSQFRKHSFLFESSRVE